MLDRPIERLAERGSVPQLQLRENLNNPDDWVIEAVRAHLLTEAPASCSRVLKRVLAEGLRAGGHYERAMGWIRSQMPSLAEWQQERIEARLAGGSPARPYNQQFEPTVKPQAKSVESVRLNEESADDDIEEEFDLMGIG